MKAIIIGSLSALVGLAAARGLAQDTTWRPAGAPAFQRVASTADSAVTLSRPVPLGAEASIPVDRFIPVFRAKTDDVPQLLPIGPASDPAKQPGTVKPMTTESLKMPRSVETAAPRIIYTSPSSTEFGHNSGAMTSFQGNTMLDECGTGCGTCVTDSCGPAWRHRCRDLAGCCDDPCCLTRPRAWIRAEYLLWGISDQQIPDLLTTGSANDARPGAIGQPGTVVLFGEEEALEGARSGGRVALGFWFTRCCNWGLDASFFMLARRTYHAEVSSDSTGNPVYARPYFQPSFAGVDESGETEQIVSFPGSVAGRATYDSTTRLWGADIHLRRKLHCGPRYWVDGFIGYRHLNLADTIDMTEDLQRLGAETGVVGFQIHDHFATRNNFNGVQVGLEGEVKFLRRWFLAGNVKVAGGNVHQTINIDGSTTFLLADGTSNGPQLGGLLALASNIGKSEQNKFAVVTEFGIKLGLDITEHLRAYAGYNVLYLSSAVRAGEQIDRVVNAEGMRPQLNTPSTLQAPLRPAVLFRTSDFWAQGGQFGLEYHW